MHHGLVATTELPIANNEQRLSPFCSLFSKPPSIAKLRYTPVQCCRFGLFQVHGLDLEDRRRVEGSQWSLHYQHRQHMLPDGGGNGSPSSQLPALCLCANDWLDLLLDLLNIKLARFLAGQSDCVL